MKTLLAEQPWTLAILLAFLGGCLLYGWLQTGKKMVALAGVVCLLLIPGAFALASSWQTDRETIESILYETAQAIEANDIETAVSVIGDDRTQEMARAELPNFVFSMARVNAVNHIKVDEASLPMTAQVEIMIKADVSGKRGNFANLRVLRILDLEFEKRSSNWVVTQYRHRPVGGGSDSFTSNTIIGQ